MTNTFSDCRILLFSLHSVVSQSITTSFRRSDSRKVSKSSHTLWTLEDLKWANTTHPVFLKLSQPWHTCQLFSVLKMREIFRLHKTWISKDLRTASEDNRRLPKINRRCRKIFDELMKIENGYGWDQTLNYPTVGHVTCF